MSASPFFRFSLRPRGLLTAAGAVAAAASLLGFLGTVHWLFDICSHFRVQYALVLGLVALLLGILRQRRTAAGYGLLAALNVALVIPLWLPRPAPPPAGAVPIRILLFNVNTRQGDPARVADLIREINPDILVLEEVSRQWLARLAPVLEAYPDSRDQPRDDNFGIALYSRLPFRQADVSVIGQAGVPSIVAEIEASAGPFTLFATHPLPPAGREYSHLRDEQLEALATAVREAGSPVLLAGDLNASPWSPYFRKLLRESGLQDSGRGRGFQPTWPTSNPLLRIPLDHVLHDPGIAILDRKVGPHAGSDHFPLIVEFAVTGR